jgi:hypothetical protein
MGVYGGVRRGKTMSILRVILCLGMWSFATMGLFGAGIDSIEEAARDNKYLFIFFYKDFNEKTLALQSVFDSAMAQLGEQARALKVKSNDPAEKGIIEKFDLKRTPMPFVLVLAPNGAVTGGFLSFTKEQLADSIASPGAAGCLKALQERKLVLLCLQNRQTSDNQGALNGVKEFKSDSRFSSATEIVMIDPVDVKEHKFLNQLGIDKSSNQATTVLISPPAEVIATYLGAVTKNQVVSDLQKANSGCCGPGGCCPGGKCGPK